jgi:hypothetical protein
VSSKHRNQKVEVIREQGRQAAREGRRRTQNPYSLRTAMLDHMQWARGYDEEAPATPSIFDIEQELRKQGIEDTTKLIEMIREWGAHGGVA